MSYCKGKEGYLGFVTKPGRYVGIMVLCGLCVLFLMCFVCPFSCVEGITVHFILLINAISLSENYNESVPLDKNTDLALTFESG